MPDSNHFIVTDLDGYRAQMSPDGEVTLPNGRLATLPREVLQPDGSGGYRADVRFKELQSREEIVIPIIREEVHVDRQTVQEGGFRLEKHVGEHSEVVQDTVRSEHVEVQRVPRDEIVDEPPGIRSEGNVTIVPVLEEVLVVQKKLRLREEIHIRRHNIEEPVEQQVTLRKETIDIHPIDPLHETTDDQPQSDAT
jgi:uncharacterized protein (TIGR02271 family)